MPQFLMFPYVYIQLNSQKKHILLPQHKWMVSEQQQNHEIK